MKKIALSLCLLFANSLLADLVIENQKTNSLTSLNVTSKKVSLDNFATPVEKLQAIHSRLALLHGSFSEEYPEQLMSATYLTKDNKVLEIGGNLGRNSCVIASILENENNLIVVESCVESAQLLTENRDYNQLNFHIEASAVSKYPLIQSGWTTIPSDLDIPGYFRVNTITFQDLQKKYDIQFDTLVVDCEGALYYILKDDPEILTNIKTIIIENDFVDFTHLHYVQNLFTRYGFQLIYNQAGGWGPCYSCFYQVWKK